MLGCALVMATGCGPPARPLVRSSHPAAAQSGPAAVVELQTVTPAAAPVAPAPALPPRALPAAIGALRRDPRLDGIATAAAGAASQGYVVSTAALRAATVAGLGSDVLPYVITARGDDGDVDAQLAAALVELRAVVALEAVGLAETTGATGRVVALVATPVPTVAVSAVRHGEDVTLSLPWPWPHAPSAFLSTPGRARRIEVMVGDGRVEVTVRCRGATAPGFGADAGLEIGAGPRLVASVPAVCSGHGASPAAYDIGPPARTAVEIEQRLFELVNR